MVGSGYDMTWGCLWLLIVSSYNAFLIEMTNYRFKSVSWLFLCQRKRSGSTAPRCPVDRDGSGRKRVAGRVRCKFLQNGLLLFKIEK